MALPMLVNNSECGPSNPLQGLSKRFDHDRGIQQDHFGTSRAGSSREIFRTANNLGPDQDAARFFSSALPQIHTPSPLFHMGQLKDTLPTISTIPQHKQQANSSWASDFLLNANNHAQTQLPPQTERAVGTVSVISAPILNQIDMRQWTPHLNGAQFMPQAPTQLFQPPHMAPHSTQSNQVSWDREFLTHETLHSQGTIIQEQTSTPQIESEGDDLSRTAGILLQNVRHDQNPKFRNSQFLGLMTKLRDREVIVEGNDMIENPNPGMSSVENATGKGKGRADESMMQGGVSRLAERLVERYPNGMDQSSIGSTERVNLERIRKELKEELKNNIINSEDENEAYFRQENEEYMKYWHDVQDKRRQEISAHGASDWGHLQNSWDQFEATSSEIKAIPNYQFQENNPYLLGDSSTMSHRNTRQLSTLESVLELEAVVQKDVTNASAWFELGVKQQENEREAKAIEALRRALALDPTHLPSWLALAVSCTNENDRLGTYNAIKEWVDRNETYKTPVEAHYATLTQINMSMTDKFHDLVACLISMARSAPESHGVDADVQIALAIILNTIDDYSKSQDCFLAALAARPEDWQLYNRVGATMANSGHPALAAEYYLKALELNPAYIRARYNLGISYINLLQYEEGAQHVLDALVLQSSDAVSDTNGMNETRGVTSAALWDTLKTCCMHMGRSDLSELCDRRNVEDFRTHFTQSGAN